MLIQILIEKAQPLSGRASTDGSAPIPFVGWLEMLRAIADLTEAAEQVTSDGSVPGGQAADGGPVPVKRTTQNERDRSES